MGQTQQGVTYRYNGKKAKTPLGKVYIKVATASNGVISDSIKGTFTLQFKGLSMGSRIGNVQVQKRGMMIFNQQAVDEWNIRKEPLRLILCDADEFEKQKQNLIAIGQREAQKRYDKKIAEIEAKYKAESAEWYQKLSEADDELQNTRKRLSEYADALARLDQSELDSQMQEVLDLYEKGEVQQAMQKLEDMHLAEKFNQTIERKQFHEKGLEAATQDSILLIEKIRSSITLYKNSGEYDKAAEYLKLLADKMNTFDDIYEYVSFCSKQRLYEEGIKYGMLAYNLVEKSGDNIIEKKRERAMILHKLAYIYSDIKQLNKAEELYLKELALRRELTNNNWSEFDNLGYVLNNLGVLYVDILKFTKSQEMLEESIDIFKKLAKDNPKRYDIDVVMGLNNLGRSFLELKNFLQAEAVFLESINVFHNLTNDSVKESDRIHLANPLHNLGLIYEEYREYDKSKKFYLESLEIRRNLAKKNPQAYEPDILLTLNALGNLYAIQLKYKDSEEIFNEGIEIARRLVKQNPLAYECDLAMFLHNMANLYVGMMQYDKAEAFYLEALDIRKRLANRNPEAYKFRESETLDALALLYVQIQRYEESEKLFIEALDNRKQLANNSEIYRFDEAKVLEHLAGLYYSKNRFEECEKLFKESLIIYGSFANENPEVFSPYVARVKGSLSQLYMITQRPVEAKEMIDSALKIYQDLARNNTYAYDSEIAKSLYLDACHYGMSNQLSEAESVLRTALAIFERLIKDDPHNYGYYKAQILYQLAGIYASNDNYTKSEVAYKEALNYFLDKHDSTNTARTLHGLATIKYINKQYPESEQLYIQAIDNYPETEKALIAQCKSGLADVYLETERLQESITMEEEALLLLKQLVAEAPQKHEEDYAMTLKNLGIKYSSVQKLQESNGKLGQALVIYKRLAAQNPEVYNPQILSVYFCIGENLIKTDNYEEAIPNFEESLRLSRDMVEKDSTLGYYYFNSLGYLGQLYANKNDHLSAYKVYKEFLPQLKERYILNKEVYKDDYSNSLGGQSFYAIFMNKFAESEQYAREGLEVDSTKHWIASNLAAALLFQGKYAEAETVYRQYKEELKDSFLDDFKQFKEANVIPYECRDEVERIMQMLNNP